ncbi:SoxR reducing system RseC family protein [Anaeromicrobium sediminis]|uniref:Uncharacterized protein n=1 Tax=Anaeromicrobium sediminis TaxID=1478221 RepID=A0A267MPT5_9FIRM|nr:SoxR reducing system RseC family protein [Anaeromicrobium sediminis]PAB60908.1 hypothetical protein CCE28_00295 [Anaeromicrobium sediminis]
MNQVGFVTKILPNNRAEVSMKKHAACGECGACQHGHENMNLNIIALNKIKSVEGNKVEVDLETSNVLGAAFIMYVIPLVTMVISIFISRHVFGNIMKINNFEIYSILTGFTCLSITFLAIRLNEKKFEDSKRYIPTITRIIE